MKTLALRWLKFHLVGGLGIVVQLACLAVFRDVLHLHYLLATALAVEVALLHNFVWHQRLTWKDRSGGSARESALRLTRFHLGNGLISLLGNVLLMRWLVGSMQIQYLIANILTISLCSLANFAASEWFVFREKRECGKIDEERAG